ncbi:MAG TPA: hypothetical protein P5545_01120, partial [Bacteroidota bacterium]|nr:hypothetical protein [Bacteroidota bacterium]
QFKFASVLGIILILMFSSINNPIHNLIKEHKEGKSTESINNNNEKAPILSLLSDNNSKIRKKTIIKNNQRNKQIRTYSKVDESAKLNENFRSSHNNTIKMPLSPNNYMNETQFAQNIQENNLKLDYSFFVNNQITKNIPNESSNFNNQQIKNFNVSVLNAISNIAKSEQVELNSFLGSDIAIFGVNKSRSAISSFTQSVAYNLNTKSKIGLETGYFQIGMDKDKYLEIKSSSRDEFGSSVNSGGTEFLIRTPGKENYEQTIIWAGLFYERNLIKYNNITLSSRLGAGYDGNGLISNLKLFANYNISNSINLTVGSESKLLLGKSYNSETNGKVGSTISLIYGVQFEF